jgi:hypothetical protein
MHPTRLPEQTIGSYLVRIRLQHRAARLEALVSMLRFRIAERAVSRRPVPGSLRAAAAEFEDELSAIRDRLA